MVCLCPMFLIGGLCGVLIAVKMLFKFEKGKSFAHVLAEAKYDFFYNIMGCVFVIDDFIHRGSNKVKLINRKDKIALITGGTRGIGVEVIKKLLQCEMHVIVGCRNPSDAEKLLKVIRENGIQTGSLEAHKLDTSSLASVKAFAKTIREKHNKIHYLINNAGIMYVPFRKSVDGFESHLATNYIGHYLLTHLLLDILKQSGQDGDYARIVNVSSCAHTKGSIDFEDINKLNKYYIPFESYAQSKLAQILFSNYLNDQFNKNGDYVQSYSLHPGIVNTDIFEDTPLKSFAGWTFKIFFKTPEEGSRTIIHAVVAPELERKGGSYLSNCIVTEPIKIALDKNIQKELYDFTRKLIGNEYFEN